VIYQPADPSTVSSAVSYPDFWKISDFQPGGPIYAVAQELGYITPPPGLSDPGPPSVSGVMERILGRAFTSSTGEVDFGAPDLSDARLSGVTLVATGRIGLGMGGSNTNTWTLYQFPKFYPADTAHAPSGRPDRVVGVMRLSSLRAGLGVQTNSAAYGVDSQGQFNFTGVIYSPNGKCSFSFPSGGSADGALICMQVDVSGSTYTLNYNPDLLPPWDPNGGIAADTGRESLYSRAGVRHGIAHDLSSPAANHLFL